MSLPTLNEAGAGQGSPADLQLFPRVRRYLRIYGELWKNSVSREMGFKTNFILWIVVEGLWFALQMGFIGVIYLHTDHIATWGKWDVVMLLGASQFIQQIFQAFFLTNCTQMSELVRTGKLDFMLLLPVNTRFLVSARQVDLGGFVNAGLGLAVMAWAARETHFVPTTGRLAAFFGLCACGVFIHYSLMFALSSVCFWTVRAQGIVWGYYSLFQIARLPDAAFQGFFKACFQFAIPMLLVANVPVKWLLQKLGSPWEMGWLLAMSGLCFWLSEFVWKKSLRLYTSASS
jgi:ABC-2 type transport system permease protein